MTPNKEDRMDRVDLYEADRDVVAVASNIAAETNAWSDQNIASGGVCDFCCNPIDEATVTTWLAKPMIETIALLDTETYAAATVDHVLSEDWACCPACDPIVEQRDALKLAEHVERTKGPRAPKTHPGTEQFQLDNLTDLYQRFFDGGARRA